MENKDMPVYPTSIKEWSCVDREMVGVQYAGLTKREMIAAMALNGILANHWCQNDYKNDIHALGQEHAAKQAVSYADALLKELSKP